jgi:hypothetical protein
VTRADVRLRLISAILIIVFPVSQIAAETGAAMLQPQGKVTVNGKEAANSVTIFPGDQVQTEADSAATITSQGQLLMLGANSSFKFGESAIDVGCGSMTVSTAGHRLAARVGNLTIDPATDSSKFEISRAGGKLQIGARDGSLLVDDGKQKARLESGKAMSFDSPGECPVPPAAVEPEVASAKPGGFALSTGKILLISALVAGGVTAAVVVASSDKNKCVSPDGSKKCKCTEKDKNGNCLD